MMAFIVIIFNKILISIVFLWIKLIKYFLYLLLAGNSKLAKYLFEEILLLLKDFLKKNQCFGF
jgi:hypothetical protein